MREPVLTRPNCGGYTGVGCDESFRCQPVAIVDFPDINYEPANSAILTIALQFLFFHEAHDGHAHERPNGHRAMSKRLDFGRGQNVPHPSIPDHRMFRIF